jgi:protein phosphatase
MEPVVDGAAGDNRGQRHIDNRSAAGRAALADPPTSPPPTSTPPTGGGPSARRRPVRLLLVAVAVLVLLGAGAIGSYMWALGHWFVGVQSTGTTEDVAVFRGLNVSVVGFDLYKFDSDSGLAVSDLTPAARTRVRGGITANDRADANRILSALRDQRLPICPMPGSLSPTSAATTSAARPTPTGTPARPASPAPRSSAPRTSATPTETLQPGVDCREVK